MEATNYPIKYRLVHLLPSELGGGCEYVTSVRGDCDYPLFSREPAKALLFATWKDFVGAASWVWTVVGPCDLMYEEVRVVPVRRISHARTAEQ